MSLRTDVITYFYNLFVADAPLISVFGNSVRIGKRWINKNTTFPYIVHRLDTNISTLDVINEAMYVIDIFDYDPQDLNIEAIMDRIITLIDKLKFSTDSTTGVRVWYTNDFDIEEEQEYLRHRTVQFKVRYDRKSEIVNILGR